MEVKILNHKGKNILYLNVSYGDMLDKKQEVLDLIEEAKSYIAKQAPNSLLTLTNATGLRFSMELVNTLKEFTTHNQPFIKAAAIVGVTGLQKIAYDTVIKFISRSSLQWRRLWTGWLNNNAIRQIGIYSSSSLPNPIFALWLITSFLNWKAISS